MLHKTVCWTSTLEFHTSNFLKLQMVLPLQTADANADADADADLLWEKHYYFAKTVRMISSSEHGSATSETKELDQYYHLLLQYEL